METKKNIVHSLALMDPSYVEINPDRPNIFLASYTRPSHGDDKLDRILSPIVDELKEKRQDFPLTLIYGNLATIAECYCFFSNKMGVLHYDPIGAQPVAKNRMFTHFHAQYPNYERERIVQELVSGTSKLRIMFVTVAFGIGVDVSNIWRVIHIGVPHTLKGQASRLRYCSNLGISR